MDIIIVGTGKAAYLHYLKYLKIGVGNILFYDKTINNKYIKNNVYLSMNELMANHEIDIGNTIVDICTPFFEFTSIINYFIALGFTKFIVEKPFIVNDNYFSDKKDIKILMIENYKYSLITKYISDYINDNNLLIKSIKINFSKNRLKDSINKRGFSNYKSTNNYEIEMPHEIYIANYFIGDCLHKNYKSLYLRDMVYNDLTFEKHGYGLIEYETQKTNVRLESNLMTKYARKSIEIVCSKDIVIYGEYIIYDSQFNVIKPGKITINNNNNCILKKEFFEDDNMYYCLAEYLRILNSDCNFEKYKDEIISFSKELTYCIENGVSI